MKAYEIVRYIAEGGYVIVFSIYFILMLRLVKGWVNLSCPEPENSFPKCSVTVIIPVRNESQNIEACIRAILKQDYPPELVQILVMDDGSEDGTAAIVQNLVALYTSRQLICVSLRPDEARSAHKKYAIEQGVEQASGELIVTTDGDCISGPGWLRSIAHFYRETGAKLIVGPVAFHREEGFFGYMQSLEFAGLMTVTGGSASEGLPLMCNGANMAYPKEIFLETGGYRDDKVASGDDVFLLHRIQEKYPDGVRFLKSRDAIVFTKPQKRVRDFIQQRTRWASKFRSYPSRIVRRVAVLVFLCNLFLLLGMPIAVLVPSFRVLYLILGGGKLIIDFLFLFLASSFIHRRKLLWVYLPEQLFYSLYVVFSSSPAFLRTYEWKGRRIEL